MFWLLLLTALVNFASIESHAPVMTLNVLYQVNHLHNKSWALTSKMVNQLCSGINYLRKYIITCLDNLFLIRAQQSFGT